MKWRLKKKKGLFQSEADLKMKERAFQEMEQEALALERRCAGVELPEEFPEPPDFMEWLKNKK